jgi:hypothetical protein
MLKHKECSKKYQEEKVNNMILYKEIEELKNSNKKFEFLQKIKNSEELKKLNEYQLLNENINKNNEELKETFNELNKNYQELINKNKLNQSKLNKQLNNSKVK